MGEQKIFLRETNWVDGGEMKEETNWVRKESCEKKNRRQGSSAKMREKQKGWVSVRVKQNVWLRKKGEIKINKLK